MKQYKPEEFTAMCKEYYPNVKEMTIEEAIAYLDEKLKYDKHCGWSIRYYGFGEHLTFWAGDGSFIDFGIDQDTKLTWDKMRQLIIESAMCRKEFEDKLNDKEWFKKGDI